MTFEEFLAEFKPRPEDLVVEKYNGVLRVYVPEIEEHAICPLCYVWWRRTQELRPNAAYHDVGAELGLAAWLASSIGSLADGDLPELEHLQTPWHLAVAKLNPRPFSETDKMRQVWRDRRQKA